MNTQEVTASNVGQNVQNCGYYDSEKDVVVRVISRRKTRRLIK